MRLSPFNPYPQDWSTEAEASYINLCNADCSQFVQAGEYEGKWTIDSEYSRIGYYGENIDPCNVYNPFDLTPLVPGGQNADTSFYIVNSGTIREDCGAGLTTYSLFKFYYNYSNFNGNKPFFQAAMSNATGLAIASTELHDQITYYDDGTHTWTYAATGSNCFGCDLNRNCGNNGYSLHLLGSS